MPGVLHAAPMLAMVHTAQTCGPFVDPGKAIVSIDDNTLSTLGMVLGKFVALNANLG